MAHAADTGRNPRILVVAGLTASGKSALAADLAAQLDGTVINADSMQLYRGVEILTAQPEMAVRAQVPHRLYGVLDPAELGTAAAWVRRARAEIADTGAEGRWPILCGGTGLYLRSLLEGMAPIPQIPAEIRSDARARLASLGGPAFHAALAALDPEAAARLDPGDRQRVARAYEVVVATGRSIDFWQRQRPAGGLRHAAKTILLLPPAEIRAEAIDRRFVRMVERGAIGEVRMLLDRNLDSALPVMRALGVRPIRRFIEGELPLSDAVRLGQQTTRQYAKRQTTWFRHQFSADLVVAEQYSERNAGQLCQKIIDLALTPGPTPP